MDNLNIPYIRPVEIILTRGFSGCGKSTWAKQVMSENPGKYKRINKDSLRSMLDDNIWNSENEHFLNEAVDALILMAVKSGKSVINGDTNLNPVHEARIRLMFIHLPWITVTVKEFFDVPIETCIERDSLKTGSQKIGKEAILKQVERWNKVKDKQVVK